MADTSFGKMIDSSPEVLGLLVPKGTKKGKNAETNLMLTYVRALRAVADVEEVLNNIPDDQFLLQSPEGQLVPAMEQVKKKASKRMEATELPAVPLN
eukprot:467242-Karenia_brevis.AAC.1